jgi:NitT/TauT family transport system permease protein
MIMYQLFWGTEESHDNRYFTYLVPSPKMAILSLIRDWEEISVGFGASAIRMIVSVLLAIVIGTPIGLIIGHEKSAERFLSPLLYITNPIPKVVLVPLLFVFFGVGNSPKIILITLLLVFPVMIAARDAAKNISKTYLLSVRSLNASKLQIYRHVILPACLPSILTTVRFSVGFAAVGLAITEAWNAKTGLWAYILNASRSYSYSDVFAGIVAFAILGIIIYALIDLIERIACRWNYV